MSPDEVNIITWNSTVIGGRAHAFLEIMGVSSATAVKTASFLPPNREILE